MTELGELRFNRLLVAVDGSASADLALSAAVTAARRDNSALTLISVAPDARAEAARWPGTLAIPQTPQDDLDAAAERILVEAVARIPADIPVERVVRRGAAGPEIVAQSRAGCYDAIPPTGKKVVGIGLSPRGNDNPLAPSNVSTSPVRFLRALGAAYRATGRKAPIMDVFEQDWAKTELGRKEIRHLEKAVDAQLVAS